MVSIKFRNLATVASQAGGSGDVRCTGDAEATAVMYGRDGRCGRSRQWARTGLGRRLDRRQSIRPVA
jgi:hypothetical protein